MKSCGDRPTLKEVIQRKEYFLIQHGKTITIRHLNCILIKEVPKYYQTRLLKLFVILLLTINFK